jgi:hypothetical protein
MTTNVQNIPGNLLAVIRECIEQEEGGWKLTSNPNDPDGGWTYAGVTRTLFEAWLKKQPKHKLSCPVRAVDIEHELELGSATDLQNDILCVYWDEFLEPITEICGGLFTYHYALFFSCAINRGMAEFRRCYAEAHSAGTLSTPKFIAAWQDGYTKLVVENANAWELFYEDPINRRMPGSKRWKFLAGWINRTQRWM